MVRPIHKKGDTDKLNNYRPIPLPSSVSKLSEKIISVRLIHFLETHEMFNDAQNECWKNKSTTKTIYRALLKSIGSLNDNKKC